MTHTVKDAVTTTYAHDADGNQTQAGARTFTYDLAGRQASTTAGGVTHTYAHDGDGTRLSMSRDGSLERAFLWDTVHALPQLAIERDGDGTPLRRYHYGLEPVSFTDQSDVFYYHTDPMGSVVDLTASDGSHRWSRVYEPFGAVWEQQDVGGVAPDNPLGFTGQYVDAETLHVHLRARQYDPRLGRFTAQDPVATPHGSPSVSSYAYVGNRPLLLIDPSGMVGVPDWLKGIGDGARETVTEALDGAQLLLSDPKAFADGFRDSWNEIARQGGGGTGGHWDAAHVMLNPMYPALVGGDAAVEAFKQGGTRQGANHATKAAISAFCTAIAGGAALRTVRKAGPTQTPTTTPGGATDDIIRGPGPRGGESTAAARGRQAHQSWNYGPGFEREFRLPSGSRVDGINFQTRQVVELKPNNPRAIRDGQRQLDRYLEELQREYPGAPWNGRVETYNP